MSNYPESQDVFTDKTGSDVISSSDPNNAYDGIEAIEGFVGSLGKPQSWSVTLLTLLRKYKKGFGFYKSGSALVVQSGEATLEDTNGTKYVFRRNTADVSLSASNIDVGAMAVATYYVYAKGGSAATTAPIIFSTDINAPSAIGTAPYRKLGWFYNAVNAAFAFTYYGVEKDNEPNPSLLFAQGATDTTTTSGVYVDLADMSIVSQVSTGELLAINFDSNVDTPIGASATISVQLLRDSTVLQQSSVWINSPSQPHALNLQYIDNPGAGTYTYKVQWKQVGGTAAENNASSEAQYRSLKILKL